MLILALLLFESYGYNPSIYAPKTDDYIVTLESDSFYLLENVAKPQKAKHIKEAKFSTTVINDDDYAWPGHPRTVDRNIEDEEGRNMNNFYKDKVDLTQNDMYYHPKAPEQSWSTWGDIDSLQRVKVKVTLDPVHQTFRTTNLYMPPGELITFEIFPDAVDRVDVYTESHRQTVEINERLKYLQCKTRLTQTRTTWGYPTGGAITFDYNNRNGYPIEINVTGCVIAPHFVYGVTDEREWEESIRNIKAPSAQISNGAVNQYMPAHTIRDLDRMDDGQAWLRSADLRSQELAPDVLESRPNDQYTIVSPIHMRYDNYVACGVACATAGANIIDFYETWANAPNKILNLKDGNQWGTIHELNHHHQSGWAFCDLDNALYEGTNNVLNTYTYTFQNSASSKREVNADLEPVCLVDHLETVHPYCLVDWAFIEAEWDIIFHCLGYEVFKKYMQLNIDNSPYSWQEYNGYGKHILTLMEATGYDVYEYCKWFCDNTDRRTPQELMEDKFDTFWQAYQNHPARGKYFHFMGCFYACGFIRNNQRFETVRPFRIYPFANTTFDFNKALRQRSGDKNLWGDFVFDKIVSKRQQAWTETSKGVFQYKPVDDVSFIDEALAYYIDRTTGEEYINIVRLELIPADRMHDVYYYKFTEDVCNREFSVEKCYENLNQHTLSRKITTSYKGIPWIEEKNLTAVTDFTFTPTETGDYVFGATISERGFVYLSNETLKGNINEDSSHLILVKHYWHGVNAGDVNNGRSEPIHLEAGKKMYIRLVVNNAHDPDVCTPDQVLCRAETGETVFVMKSDEAEFNNDKVLPDEWFEISEPVDFKPSLIDFKFNDVYKGDEIIKNSPDGWTASVSMNIKDVYTQTNTNYDEYQGVQCTNCDDTDVSNTLISWDPTTEVRSGWWPADKRQEFPHKYDINFNRDEHFNSVYLKGAYNQNHFPMKSKVSIYLNSQESSSEGIETSANLIWEGDYDSKTNPVLRLSKQYTGKYLRVVVHDNTAIWKGGNLGMSCFSILSVGFYSCLSKYKVPRGCNWEVRKDGYYINGRAFVGKQGDTYEYVPDAGINQVAICGDRFTGMGTAKVYIDGNLVKTISDKDIDMDDINSLKYTSRSYRKILYATPMFTNRPTIRIVVESGEFRMTGLVVGSEDKSVIINNGPVPTQTPTAYPEPTKIPGPSDDPDTESGPSIDSTSQTESDDITFTKDGFTDNTNHDTTNIKSDIILIKSDSTSIALKAESENAPSQDRYLSVQKPGTEITIQVPPSGDYGKGEFGIHANSQGPKIKVSTASVPLNFYNDNDNSITLETIGAAASSESITILKITSTKGKLSFNLPDNAKHIEAKEINLFNKGRIESKAGSNLIETIIGQLNLKGGSNSTISHVNIKNGVSFDDSSVLYVEEKATFNSASSITLSESSFLEFGKSTIEGVCGSLNLSPSTAPSSADLLSDEKPLICGEKFDCKAWSGKYKGNDAFPYSKCSTIDNEKCIVASKKKSSGGKSKAGLIAGVVIAVIIVIAAVVVGVIIYLRKKRTQSSSAILFSNFSI